MKSIEKDVEFLTECRIIDYSLLVGIHEIEKNESIFFV